MITARKISLTKGGREILRHIDLDITPGQLTVVAGPNGAGKSSLLKVLSGEIYSGGQLLINGIPATSYSVAQLAKVRSVLPQSSHVQFPFTVRQIVTSANSTAPDTTLITEVMKVVDVDQWADRNFLTLSGGEQQRVHLARVLLQVWKDKDFPRYVLLDEPTSSLDLLQQQLVFNVIRKACERNIGVFAIVHDLNHIAQFADQLYFIRDGQIQSSGDTRKVFTKENIEETFCCRVNVYHDPCNGCPYVVPERTLFTPVTKQEYEYRH